MLMELVADYSYIPAFIHPFDHSVHWHRIRLEFHFKLIDMDIKYSFNSPVKKDNLLIAGNGWLPEVSNKSN